MIYCNLMPEILKCSKDPLYFIVNFVEYNHPYKGLTNLTLSQQHKDVVKAYHESNKIIWNGARETYKTLLSSAYILWYSLFNSDKTSFIVSLNKQHASDTLKKIMEMYRLLPAFMQLGIEKFNENCIEFTNGSRILFASQASSMRGYTINLLFLDDFAFHTLSKQRDFWHDVFPMLTRDPTSKLILASSPSRYDYTDIFLGLFKATLNGLDSDFTLIYMPKLDYDKKQYIDQAKFNTEYLCKYN